MIWHLLRLTFNPGVSTMIAVNQFITTEPLPETAKQSLTPVWEAVNQAFSNGDSISPSPSEPG